MDAFVEFLISYGNAGMFLAALLSGSIAPFISSEAVLIALLAVGAEPWGMLLWGTVGNVLGGIIIYYLGYIGSPQGVERRFRIDHDKMQRATKLVCEHGALAAAFGWVPLLGSAIMVVLGVMRADTAKTLLWMTLGKFLRYLVIVLSAVGISLLVQPTPTPP